MNDSPATAARPPRTNGQVIFAITLVHFSGDFFSSFIIPLLPLFADRFALTLAQVGVVTGLSRILAFIVQPLTGYLADRHRTRLFVLGGLSLVVLFVPLTGVAPGFLLLLLFVGLASIGSSMFHPTCAGMVPDYAGRKPGLSMSVFNTGGTLSFGVGPIFIAWYVGAYGLESMPWLMAPGAVVMAYLLGVLPPPRGEGLRELGFLGSMRDAFGGVWRPILVLWFIMVLRSYTGQSFFTFLPVLFVGEGYSLVSVGSMVSLFTVGGALSGILAGHLSDRIGFRKIFYVTHGLAAPAFLLMLSVSGRWVHVSAFLAGFLVLATLPLGVLMAQEMAPRGRSMVSSLMMGLAFGTGGMLAPLTGKLGDLFGVRPVLAVVGLIPLLTTALVPMLPERRTGRPLGRKATV
jgi:FSR family fosmidomycin resistance protein-like MFS transporter